MQKFLGLSLKIIIIPLNFFLWTIIRPRKKMIQQQLTLARLDPGLSKAWYKNMSLFIREFVFMIGRSSFELLGRTQVHGYNENMLPYLKDKKACFALTAHLGNWEWLLALSKALDIPLLAIVKRVKIKFVQDWITQFRTSFGLELIWEEDSLPKLKEGLSQGKVTAFILDQYMGPPVGVKVNFFGRGAGTMKALALLAKRYKVDVVPVFCYRESPFKMRVEFLKPLPWQEIVSVELETQKYTTIIEEAIRKEPAQWFWIHRRWKEDTSPVI